jgi:hypothetical protein
VNTTAPYPTEYRIERFYPSYYNQRQPEQGLPNQLFYGGSYFKCFVDAGRPFRQRGQRPNSGSYRYEDQVLHAYWCDGFSGLIL